MTDCVHYQAALFGLIKLIALTNITFTLRLLCLITCWRSMLSNVNDFIYCIDV